MLIKRRCGAIVKWIAGWFVTASGRCQILIGAAETEGVNRDGHEDSNKNQAREREHDRDEPR